MTKTFKLLLITFALFAFVDVQAADKLCAPASYYAIVDAQDKRVIAGYEFTTRKDGTFTIKQADKVIYSNCDLYGEVIARRLG